MGAARRERSRPSRVVVVGGGAAGLAAAAALARRTSVVLLEGRDRLFGRVDTRHDPALGLAVEGGAEFVHGRPERTLALARRARARLLVIPDRHLRREGARASDAGEAFGQAQELLAEGTRDGEPFSAVLDRARRAGRASPEALRMARAFVRGFYLADPGTASSLALAEMTRALDAIGGDAMLRVEGGYVRVLEPLEADLARAGVEVRRSTVVHEVRWRPGAVEVHARGAAGGRLPPVRGDRLVVTVPAGVLADGLRFSPPLRDKRRAAAALRSGPIVKVLLRFRRPPWGQRPLVFLHVPGAPVPVLWTVAPLEAPLLVGWAGGPFAAPLAGRPHAEVVRAAIASVARGLGARTAAVEAGLDGATVVDWTADPLAGGGYAVFPVGSAGAAAALARSVAGTLFFAGEATAGGHAGTVDGALQSGERAAAEVLGER